jgi:hypothetical protein
MATGSEARCLVKWIERSAERTTLAHMAMGKRKRNRQPAMWVTTTDLPTAASHPFYRRLNQLLREHGFDDFVEAQCAAFYAETMDDRGCRLASISGCC